MKVQVYSHYSETMKTFEGSPEQVLFELFRQYPWLNKAGHEDVQTAVKHINSTQAYSAKLTNKEPLAMTKTERGNLIRGDEKHVIHAMLGHDEAKESAFDAARWLAGGKACTPQAAREALWEADGDVEEAALLAHGLEVNNATLKALRSVGAMSGGASKKPPPEPLEEKKVIPGHPDASEFAEKIERAFKDRFVFPVELGGKHSKGSLLARDRDSGEVFLLKPGSGGMGPAAGEKEDASSQSRREAAFYHVAKDWGLGEYIPETQLILIDDEESTKEYAAIKLLPWSYRQLNKLKEEEVGEAIAALRPYINSGVAHQWAVLDYVLGNVDRHAANLMVRDGDIKLIDHGSSMAGESFDPTNKNTFVPYYLRASASGRFSSLSPEEKLKVMPSLGNEAEEKLNDWVKSLKDSDLDKVLQRYGVNPAPAKERLSKLKMGMGQYPAYVAINRLWAGL